MSPIGLIRYLDFFQVQSAVDGSVAEFVFDEECLEYLWNTYPTEMRTAVETEHCTFWKSSETPPFSLIIVDDATVWLGIHDDEGVVKGAIVNDSNDAVDWARDTYHRYHDRSNRVTPRNLH